MGKIIAFKPDRSRSRAVSDSAGAEILWFTGVRYMRVDPVDVAPLEPAPLHRRRRTSVRSRSQRVGASVTGG